MDDSTIERLSLSAIRFSFVRWYIYVKKPFFVFQTFQLILLHTFIAREWKREGGKRDFMIFANLSEEAQLLFFV